MCKNRLRIFSKWKGWEGLLVYQLNVTLAAENTCFFCPFLCVCISLCLCPYISPFYLHFLYQCPYSHIYFSLVSISPVNSVLIFPFILLHQYLPLLLSLSSYFSLFVSIFPPYRPIPLVYICNLSLLISLFLCFILVCTYIALLI